MFIEWVKGAKKTGEEAYVRHLNWIIFQIMERAIALYREGSNLIEFSATASETQLSARNSCTNLIN